MLINLMHVIRPLPEEEGLTDETDLGEATLQNVLYKTIIESAKWPETDSSDWCGEYVPPYGQQPELNEEETP